MSSSTHNTFHHSASQGMDVQTSLAGMSLDGSQGVLAKQGQRRNKAARAKKVVRSQVEEEDNEDNDEDDNEDDNNNNEDNEDVEIIDNEYIQLIGDDQVVVTCDMCRQKGYSCQWPKVEGKKKACKPCYAALVAKQAAAKAPDMRDGLTVKLQNLAGLSHHLTRADEGVQYSLDAILSEVRRLCRGGELRLRDVENGGNNGEGAGGSAGGDEDVEMAAE